MQPTQDLVVADPVKSDQAFESATAAVKLELQNVNESQQQCAATMDQAFIDYQPSLRERPPHLSAPDVRARAAWKYLGSIANTMNVFARGDRSKQRSTTRWMFDALTEGIRLAKDQRTVEAERVALNGAGAANMLANLVQSPVQTASIGKHICVLHSKVVELSKTHDAEHLQKAQRNLKAAIQEARKISTDMQSKVRALEQVAKHAECILFREAQNKKRKAVERASAMNAAGLCGGFRLALRNLNDAYADKDSVYAQFGVALSGLEAEFPNA